MEFGSIWGIHQCVNAPTLYWLVREFHMFVL